MGKGFELVCELAHYGEKGVDLLGFGLNSSLVDCLSGVCLRGGSATGRRVCIVKYNTPSIHRVAGP